MKKLFILWLLSNLVNSSLNAQLFIFAMYPKPVVKNFNINLINTRNETSIVQVYDAGKVTSGKDLWNASGIKEHGSISNLPASVYFVKIKPEHKASLKN